MRWLALVFVVLIVALQYPMWLGKGGWLQVRELDRQLSTQREANAKLKARNDRLDADVGDLKTGYEAIEERARSELGMVRQDEVFFQLQDKAAPAAAAGESTNAGATDTVDSPATRKAEPGAGAASTQAVSAGGMISPVSAPASPRSPAASAPGHASARDHAGNRP